MALAFFACMPLVAVFAIWIALRLSLPTPRLRKAMWWALCVTSANALYACWVYVYYRTHPVPASVPPWKDPEVLDFGLLFLFAPVGMVLGLVGRSEAPPWLVAVVELASALLFLLGLMAGSAV